MFYKFLKAICRTIINIYGGIDTIGIENIPREGGALLCANHASYIDPPVLGCVVPRKVYFMAKQELFKIPVLGWIIKRVGAFPVKRGSADRWALKKAIELLNDGECVAIFPEGTRNPGDQLGPAEPGAGMIAMHTNVPIIPIALLNTSKMLPPHHIFMKRARLKCIIGEPLDVEDIRKMKGRAAIDAISQKIISAIDCLIKLQAK